MAKFFDVIGFGYTEESAPGVARHVLEERKYFGEEVRASRGLDDSKQAVANLTVAVTISIVANAYAHEHIFAMKYIRWQGALWEISDVRVEHPRLILRLGGVYTGKRGKLITNDGAAKTTGTA